MNYPRIPTVTVEVTAWPGSPGVVAVKRKDEGFTVMSITTFVSHVVEAIKKEDRENAN